MISSSVPQATPRSVIETCISPGMLGSSNLSVYRIRSFGVSSMYVPPKEWLVPVPKFVNDIPEPPPTRVSISWTLPVKPCGGSHLPIASGSRNARYTRAAGARSTRWSRMVFAEFDISSLSFEVRDPPEEGDRGLVHSSNELPSNRHPAVIFPLPRGASRDSARHIRH